MTYILRLLPFLNPSKNRSNFFFHFSIAFIIFTTVSLAQLSEGGVPYSFNNNIQTDIERVVLPSVDVNQLLSEDAEEEKKGVPFRFGMPVEVDYNLINSGTWTELPDGGKLWRLNIFSEGAVTINLVYNDFWLPRGAKFFIYNEDRRELIGAFTERNNKEDGQFATGLIRGESIILEYYEPANPVVPGIINISSVVHGYKDIFKEFSFEDFGSSGSCNNNVNCPEGVDWENEIRAVAMILTAGNSRLCSGAMVNNVRQDLTPYFLTANHCLSSSPSTWIIMFNYQSPACTNQEGPLNYTVQGTQIKASNSASDFALLLLNEAPPDSYRVHFAGWSAIDVPSLNSTGIHHPRGDIKKISFDYEPPTSHAWTNTPANSHWRIASWNDGTTEPGSSGSPLFDQNHRITGQLHGGLASCTVIDYDSYGKFSFSWNYGSSPSSRLKDWLDPDNTGTLLLDGWDPTIGTPDTVAPSVISDLIVNNITSNSLMINWTAPLDTSYGGVRQYEIRYSQNPINNINDFNAASPLVYPGTPLQSGLLESYLIEGLDFSTTYYFAIRSRDNWNNWSALSNSASGITFGAPLLSTSPDSISYVISNSTTIVDTIFISNVSINPSTLDYTVELSNNIFPDRLKVKLIPGIISKENSGLKDEPDNNFGLSIEGSGGPDNFGYRWIDNNDPSGPLYQWNDISTTGTKVTSWVPTGSFDARDEGVAGPFPLGFNFKFYGEQKTQVYINTNGVILFNNLNNNIFSNQQIPNANTPNGLIAPFWDDLDGRTQGSVHYKQEGDKFIVQFTNWQKYNGTGSLTFQAVINSNGKIDFYYHTMAAALNSSTIGIESPAGNDGLQVVYNANYIQNSMAIRFAADPEWLAANNINGTIFNGNYSAVELIINSEDFPTGNYSMDFVVRSNDPVNSQKIIPVKMSIQDNVPVELITFDAETENNKVSLNWVTATELNNSGFSVQRRNSEKDEWAEISFIKGYGNSTEKIYYQFSDENLQVGNYQYRLKQIDFDGAYEFSNIIEVKVTAPTVYSLLQNYPNPFNPSTRFEFSLPEKSNINLSIYSATGELVHTIINGTYEAGYYQAIFNAAGYSSGIYFYRLTAAGETSNFIQTKKMMLIK